MNKVLILPVLLLAAPLVAQKDMITLRDGTQINNVKVTAWTAKDIQFKGKSGSDLRLAHLVKDASIDKVRVVMNRAGTNPEVLVGAADENKKDAIIAGACLHKAAMTFYEDGDIGKMMAALQRIDTDYPNSPYAPSYYTWKIKYYLATKKTKDAAAIALKYGDASRTRPWSEAYSHDAELWEKVVNGVAGKLKGEAYATAMRETLAKSTGVAPFVAHRAAVELADAYRGGKKFAEAKKEYEKLQKLKGLGVNVRARMYLGLGHIDLEKADSSKKKEDYHDAFLNFLRVYLNAKDADPELVAEGLYHAAKSCEAWGELPSCREMAGRLRGRLRLREPYKSTSWAKKK